MAEQLVLDTDFNITKAEAKINKLNREFNESNRKANEIAEKISELNKKLTSNEDKNFFAQKALERAETEVDKLQAKLANIDINHPAYEIYARKVEEAKEEASKWLNTCDKLDKKIKKSEQKFKNKMPPSISKTAKQLPLKKKLHWQKTNRRVSERQLKRVITHWKNLQTELKDLPKEYLFFRL